MIRKEYVQNALKAEECFGQICQEKREKKIAHCGKILYNPDLRKSLALPQFIVINR